MIHFIVNPAAGTNHRETVIREIHEAMKTDKREYVIHETGKTEDVVAFTRKAVEEGAEAIISAGGDGTLNEVASAVCGSDIPLGIIGSGSGNDFMFTVRGKSVKFSADSVREDLKRALEGVKTPVDMVTMNGTPFINIASIGLDSEIAEYSGRLKPSAGRYAYLLACIIKVFTFKHPKLRICVNGKQIDEKTTLIALSNGKRYGGVFVISPKASITDGKINICYVPKINRMKLFVLFPSVLFGKHEGIKVVRTFEAEEVSIESDDEIILALDGNVSRHTGRLVFKTEPSAINLLM